jgi:hypothetical protein
MMGPRDIATKGRSDEETKGLRDEGTWGRSDKRTKIRRDVGDTGATRFIGNITSY